MKTKTYGKRNLLYIVLACVCYIAFIPMTIIQAIYFVMQYSIDNRILFFEHDPLSQQIYDIIVGIITDDPIFDDQCKICSKT